MFNKKSEPELPSERMQNPHALPISSVPGMAPKGPQPMDASMNGQAPEPMPPVVTREEFDTYTQGASGVLSTLQMQVQQLAEAVNILNHAHVAVARTLTGVHSALAPFEAKIAPKESSNPTEASEAATGTEAGG